MYQVETVAERHVRLETLSRARALRRGAPAGEQRALTVADVPAAMLAQGPAGPPVSVRESIGLVDAWAVVSVIARTAAQMPPLLYRSTGGGRERVSSGVGAELLRRPAPGMARSAFVASAVLCTALWGEVFVAKWRRGDGTVAGLGLLAPDAVEVELLPTGEPTYTTTISGRRRTLTRADVCHGMLFSLDGRRGISPVRQAREALGLNRALGRQAVATAANQGVPRGVLTVPAGPAGDDIMANLSDTWAARHQGPDNAGRVAVVSGEIDFKPVAMPLADQEFLESRRFSTAEVCRVWGCPPWAVGADTTSSMTYSNLETQQLDLVRRCVTSYVQPLEEALSADDEIAPGDEYVELLAEGVLRGDTAGRYSAYQTALSAGFLTVDEVRRRENLEPLPAAAPPPTPVAQEAPTDA